MNQTIQSLAQAMAEKLREQGTPAGMKLYVLQHEKEPVLYGSEDFPLGPACDLSGEGSCEACQ